jgi:hypothetical protein
VALETGTGRANRAKAGERQQQDYGAGDGQRDPGKGIRHPVGEVEEMIQRRLEERSWAAGLIGEHSLNGHIP